MKEIIVTCDGYKLSHHFQYPKGTEMVYSNWTPRSCKYFPEASEGSVVFGIQYLVKEYLIKQFNENFFNLPKEQAIKEFQDRVDNFVGRFISLHNKKETNSEVKIVVTIIGKDS